MRLIFPALPIAAFTFCVLLSTPCQAFRIYRFVNYPLIQEGHTLDGTITVTDDAPVDSFLDTDEILDREWTVAGPNNDPQNSPIPGTIPGNYGRPPHCNLTGNDRVALACWIRICKLAVETVGPV